MFKDKRGVGGMTIGVVIALVIGVVVLILLLLGFRGGTKQTFAILSDQADALGNCDEDGVANLFDKCPTLSTLTSSDLRDDFRGCPVKTSVIVRDNDLNTYKWPLSNLKDCDGYDSRFCYKDESGAVYIPNCAGDNDELCQEVNGAYLSRCDNIHSAAEAVPQGVAGLPGSRDFTATLTLYDQQNRPVLVSTTPADNQKASYGPIDLKGVGESVTIKVDLQVFNLGSDPILPASPLKAKFYVCDFLDHQKCKEIPSYEDRFFADEFSEYEIISAVKNNPQKLDTRKIYVGENGDACDGKEAEKKCYVKLILDPENSYQETDENNNEVGFLVNVRNQYSLQAFKAFSAVEFNSKCLFSWWDSSPKEFSYSILKGCPVDELKNIKECGINLNTENSIDGAYPIVKAGGNNCWIFASREVPGDNPLGGAQADEGTVIHSVEPRKFPPYNFEGDPEAICLFQYGSWNNPPGSLICKQNIWYRCDQTVDKQFIIVSEKKYQCVAGIWMEQ
ncbi:MAG TPA: hypothetical protein VJC39_00330 [Candidatus Nanoarchaeia archaeon]|nr:hypothetical protein [Candidatus Nanoarchaeia archaeon]